MAEGDDTGNFCSLNLESLSLDNNSDLSAYVNVHRESVEHDELSVMVEYSGSTHSSEDIHDTIPKTYMDSSSQPLSKIDSLNKRGLDNGDNFNFVNSNPKDICTDQKGVEEFFNEQLERDEQRVEFHQDCARGNNLNYVNPAHRDPLPIEDQSHPSAEVLSTYGQLNRENSDDFTDKLNNSSNSISSHRNRYSSYDIAADEAVCADSLKFWEEIGDSGPCYTKTWIELREHFHTKFSSDPLAKPKGMTMKFLEVLLGVSSSGKDKVVVKCVVIISIFLKVVRFFGPVKADEKGLCILLQELEKVRKGSTLNIEGKKISWFGMDMTRWTAEEKLGDQKDGTYLVRMSESSADSGNFVVSVVHSSNVYHIEIEGIPKDAFKTTPFEVKLMYEDETFSNLVEVMKFIFRHPICPEEIDATIYCSTVYPDMPNQAFISGYTKQKKRK
ncbi:hypothetical protein ScPMuIL_013346 [Solemya velum]